MIPDQPLITTLRRRQLMKGAVAGAAAGRRSRSRRPGTWLTATDIAHDLRLLLQH